MIANVRIAGTDGDCFRSPPISDLPPPPQRAAAREFVGRYRYKLRRRDGALRIAERRAILDAEGLGSGLGSVSFLL